VSIYEWGVECKAMWRGQGDDGEVRSLRVALTDTLRSEISSRMLLTSREWRRGREEYELTWVSKKKRSRSGLWLQRQCEHVRREVTLCPSDRPVYSTSFVLVSMRLLDTKIRKLWSTLSSGTWRCLDFVRTYVSEERVSSILRVEAIRELGTAFAVTSRLVTQSINLLILQ
jgi:hypothetical protein